MAEFNLFDLLRKAKKPFEGVGETFSELNLLGSSVPESFKQMRDVGLLDTNAYNDAVAKADKRGKRNALIQGALRFGLQDFNKNVGSAFNPVYLKSPLLSAIDASQKSYDQLPTNAMKNIQFSEFKRKKDLETSRLAMIEKLKTSPNISDEERQMLPYMTTPQVVEASKPTTYKAPIPRKKYFTKDGVRYVQDQIFNESTGKLSDVGEPRTEFKPTEYKPSNPTKTQEKLIKVKLKNAFPGLSSDEITESIGYVWDVVDKDVFTNKSPINTSVDNVIKDFANKGVITNEKAYWGMFNDATLSPEKIYDDNVMQPPEEVKDKEEPETKPKPKTIVFKKITYKLGTDDKYYPIEKR